MKFHWNVFPVVQSKISQNWLSYGFGAKQMAVTDHYLNQWWHSLVMHLCVAWHQWVNSQGPCDASLHQYPSSLLAELKLSFYGTKLLPYPMTNCQLDQITFLRSILSKMHLEIPSAIWRPFCLGLKRMQTFAHNVLKWIFITELFCIRISMQFIFQKWPAQ